MPPVHAEAGKSIKSVVEDRFDGLVKSQKSEFFARVFSFWCLVFSILISWYSVIYVILNTKYETPNT